MRKILAGHNAIALYSKADGFAKKGQRKRFRATEYHMEEADMPQRKDYFEVRPHPVETSGIVMTNSDSATVVADIPEPLGSRRVSVDGSQNFLFHMSGDCTAPIFTITSDSAGKTVSIDVQEIYPRWSDNDAYSWSSGTGTTSTSLTLSGKNDGWYIVKATIGANGDAERTGILETDCGEFFKQKNVFKTRGWRMTDGAFLENYYGSSHYIELPVPANTEVTLHLLSHTSGAAWWFTYNAIHESQTTVSQSWNGGEELTATLEARPEDTLYYIEVSSYSAQDDRADFWLESDNENVYMYYDGEYYIKRTVAHVSPSANAWFWVDDDKEHRISLTRLDDNSYTCDVSIVKGSDTLQLEHWGSNTLDMSVQGNKGDSFSLHLSSTQTHLGPGPFVSPDAPLLTTRWPILSGFWGLSSSIPESWWMKFQTGGRWTLRGSTWVFEGSGIPPVHSITGPSVPSSPDVQYTATRESDGQQITVTAAQLMMKDNVESNPPVSNRYINVWQSDGTLKASISPIRDHKTGPLHYTGFPAVYEEHKSGFRDTLNYTWTPWPHPNDIYFMVTSEEGVSSWSHVGRFRVYTYNDDTQQGQTFDPSVTRFSPHPDPADAGPPERFETLFWDYEGGILIYDGAIMATSKNWTSRPIGPKIIDRQTLIDEVGDVLAIVYGWASF